MLPGTSKALDSRLAFLEGDYFPGLVFNIRVNGEPPDSDASSCNFVVRRNELGEDILKELTNGSGITITSANLWTFTIAAQAFSGFKAGTYFWIFRVTKADGETRTYLKGTLIVGPKASSS
jgi:hypothetical protein